MRASHPRLDWHLYAEDNNPRQTPWAGYDRGYFGVFGSAEAPDETAAVPNDEVMASVEPEHDPLVAARRARDENQAITRRELDRRVELEDSNRELERRLETLERDYSALEGTQDRTVNTLNQTERERDRAQDQIQQLRFEMDMPEEALRESQVRQDRYEQTRLREVGFAEQVGILRRSEAVLTNELQARTAGADRLEERLEAAEYERDGFGDERNHWERVAAQVRAENRNLQGQIQAFGTQLAAAQGAANDPPIVIQPVGNVAVDIAPLVVQAPVAARPGGTVRGGARGRAGRGREGAATVVREQPGRSCKVRKNYKT